MIIEFLAFTLISLHAEKPSVFIKGCMKPLDGQKREDEQERIPAPYSQENPEEEQTRLKAHHHAFSYIPYPESLPLVIKK